MKKIISSLLFIFCLSSVFAQSRTEKKIVAAVDKYNGQSVELLNKVVNINSGTMNFEGVKKVGEIFIKELTELGLDAKWVPGDAWNRAGHVVATHEGGKGPKILMIGHLDTVFEPENPFQQYTMLNDSIMKGPGVSDMKGGDVIILLTLRALKEAGVLKNMNIEVVMTGDEEKSGSPIELSKKALKEAAERADYALGFENADGKHETMIVARRGSMGWTLKVKGNPAHSSQIFTEKVGVGAIYEASRILNEFYLQLSKEENLTFNPGFILGGTVVEPESVMAGGKAYGKTNVVAEDVIVKGDLRAINPEQVEKTKRIMQEIVKNNYPGTSAEITFSTGGYPPFAPTDG
ncbi:MAG: M20/M25/M40 family metallo-hydrolase, partial [Cyclobacteriaceae bacterium]|nr:M20/M25/M40 family metallo-hydrolase [Cyclobacteriaceae bacterium]